jgi:hypothetical protein
MMTTDEIAKDMAKRRVGAFWATEFGIDDLFNLNAVFAVDSLYL